MNTAVSNLGGLAVGSLMGVIREMAAHGLPKEWHGDVTKLIDQVTTQLGGKPLDSARSSQLFDALGLGGHHDGSQAQGAAQQGGQGGSPPSQQGGQGGSPSSFYGTRGGPGGGRPSQRL